MISSKVLHNARVCTANKKGKMHKYGKVKCLVFHPRETRAVGVIVKRPDFLLMFKRKERFLALDSVDIVDRALVLNSKAKKPWDEEALDRLDIDFDECIIWERVRVAAEDGTVIGAISSVDLDEKDSFKIQCIHVGEGAINRALLGSSELTRDQLVGLRGADIVVKDECIHVKTEGGVADKAGAAWASASHATGKLNEKATEKTVEAIDKGAYKAGQAIGAVKKKVAPKEAAPAKKKPASSASKKDASKKAQGAVDGAAKAVGKQLGKSKGMFKGFKDEYKKAVKGDK